MNVAAHLNKEKIHFPEWLSATPPILLWSCTIALLTVAIGPYALSASTAFWWCRVLLTAASLTEAYVCFWRFQTSDRTWRGFWIFLVIAASIRSCALFLEGLELTVWRVAPQHTHPSDLLFFAWILPLVLLLSIPTESERDSFFYWASAIQVVLLLTLFFNLIFGSFPFFRTWSGLSFERNAYIAFVATKFVIAIGAGLRWWSHPRPTTMRRFFLVLFCATSVYAVTSLCYSVAVFLQPGASARWTWLLFFAELILIFLIIHPPPIAPNETRSSGQELLVAVLDHGAVALPVAAGVMSVLVAPAHFFLAVAATSISLSVFAIQTIRIQVRYRKIQSEMAVLHTHLHDLTLTDPLTGIGNRRGYDIHIGQAWEWAGRSARTFALLVIDIDYFKMLNDVFGHHEGDLCLRAVSHVLVSISRNEHDYMARYGGEEFVVILHDIDAENAEKVAKRICRAIGALQLRNKTPIGHVVTVSVGIGASCDVDTSNELFQLADAALYQAKQTGRNRVFKSVPESRSGLKSWNTPADEDERRIPTPSQGIPT
ncbi:MAG TPA: diguanylate cyclase [Granulicella sp.]